MPWKSIAGLAIAAVLSTALVSAGSTGRRQQCVPDPLHALMRLQSSPDAPTAPVRSIGALLLAESFNWEEMAALATTLGAPQYSVMASGATVQQCDRGSLWLIGTGLLSDGTPVAFPQALGQGEAVDRGAIFNAGAGPVTIRPPHADDDSLHELKPRELVFVGAAVTGINVEGHPVPVSGAGQCSVSCGQNYFSCCNCIGQKSECKCCSSSQVCPSCTAGGPGSSGCSICCNCGPGGPTGGLRSMDFMPEGS